MIILVGHQTKWRGEFVAEAARLRALFGERALRIDHVGSTSVLGLMAKPVIDIQVSFATLEPRQRLDAEVCSLGYVHVDLGAFDEVYPFFAKPGTWPSTHHVHLCVAGSEEERNHLAFRDYLRLNASAAQEYEKLKLELAGQHEGTTLESQERYSLAKSEFIRAALASALRCGLPLPSASDG